MIAALLIALKPIMVLGNWGWLLWGLLCPFAHPCLYYSVVVHEVPLFCVVKYSVVLNDNIKLLLHRDALNLATFTGTFFFLFSWAKSFFFFPRFLHADLCNPLKAQLGYCGLSYHSSGMNVLIISCGRTVCVITNHSSWAGGTTVGCTLWAGWLNTEGLFTAHIEMSCSWTRVFLNVKLANVFLDLGSLPHVAD